MAYSLGERAAAFEESPKRCAAWRARRSPRISTAPPRRPCARAWSAIPRTARSGWSWGSCCSTEKGDPEPPVAALGKVPSRSRRTLAKPRGCSAAARQAVAPSAPAQAGRGAERRMSGPARRWEAKSRRPSTTGGTVAGLHLRVRRELGRHAHALQPAVHHQVLQQHPRLRPARRVRGPRRRHARRGGCGRPRVLGEARESGGGRRPLHAARSSRAPRRAMARAVAGLYSAGRHPHQRRGRADPAEPSATLVHEYVHAAVDDFCGGADTGCPPGSTRASPSTSSGATWARTAAAGVTAQLRALAKSGGIPRLAGHGSQRADQLQRAASGLRPARRSRCGRWSPTAGLDRLLELMRDVGSGTSFEDALQARYGRVVEQLQGDVRDELGRK